ncbi:MAG: UDP-N-acetylmuramoyl-L-alanine--D-glutamate ligase [Candidatus Tectomicrobia bacterium]|uniref:UDP-N-acetylmuramoylalanine--D-glutamate ligase n=1 Tax=Tectimicrobiota bacterium TaxID=2528274 RepID=A0A932CQF2_UNCTE|nr:UDP-N-acetylmuramoyl-L-alanine--D-glutamate ligase [Candidatus Tectomicrobia bacterium]
MTMADFAPQGLRVTVMGMARSGIAAARLLCAQGARVLLSEHRPTTELAATLEELNEELWGADGLFPLELETGGHRRESFVEADLVVVSPGVPWSHPLLEEVRAQGIPVIGEVELAYVLLKKRDRGTPCTLLAITGTNGKSTTTSLIGEMLRCGGRQVMVAGNIGYPLSQALLDAAPGLPDYLVAEISSFQLEGVEHFRPQISLVLNLTPDHLDRHGGMVEYGRQKQQVYARQGPGDCLILNHDDPLVRGWGSGGPMRRLFFSRRMEPEEGAFLRGEEMIFRSAGREETVASLGDLRIPGAHNQENALAALAAAFLCGVEAPAIREALQAFRGLEHRMELVREVNGVRFLNDSKGTNLGAMLKSLEGMEAPVILLAGGRAKDHDFTPLRALVREKVKTLLLFGEARGWLRASLEGCAPILEVANLEEAVRTAWGIACAGEVVLLSPGCASFDQFANYAERGQRFREIVARLDPVDKI